jgi:hypothetical protein
MENMEERRIGWDSKLWYIEKKRSKNEKHRWNPNSDEEPDMQTSNNHILSYRQQNRARNSSMER